MEFRVLGSLETLADGEPVVVRAPLQRSLLVALLLRGNQVTTLDRLIDALWGQTPPRSAVANLRTHVDRLRRNLSRGRDGEARVLARPGGYLIKVGPGELDLTRFDELVTAGCNAARHHQHGVAAWRFGQALALWRGRPFEDVTLHHDTQATIARLDEMRLKAVEGRIRARMATGDHTDLVAELRGLVVEHPLRERLWALLIDCLHRTGRRADALTAYHQARTQLVTALGLEPCEDLRRLHHRVLTEENPAYMRKAAL